MTRGERFLVPEKHIARQSCRNLRLQPTPNRRKSRREPKDLWKLRKFIVQTKEELIFELRDLCALTTKEALKVLLGEESRRPQIQERKVMVQCKVRVGLVFYYQSTNGDSDVGSIGIFFGIMSDKTEVPYADTVFKQANKLSIVTVALNSATCEGRNDANHLSESYKTSYRWLQLPRA